MEGSATQVCLKMDKKVSKSFRAWCTDECTDDYADWEEGLTLYITKDGVTLQLNSAEIKALVAALPTTVGGSY